MSELSPEARALIDATVLNDEPSAADRQRVAGRISAQLGIAAATIAGVGAAASPLAASAASESAFTSAVPGVLATAKTSVSAVVIKTIAAALAITAVATTAMWALRPSASNSKPNMPASEAAADRSGIPEPLPPAVTALAPGRETGADVVIPQASPGELSRVPDVKPALESKEKKVSTRVESTNAQPASTGSVGSLERELALIGSAQKALREGDPPAALLRAREHLTSFPHGALREEALAVQALANCAQGAAREQTIREFEEQAPGSLLSPHVHAACSEGAK